MHIVKTNPNGERRRHNGYGVDVVGYGANLDRAFAALNSHERLVQALRGLVGFVDDLDRTHCGLDDFAQRYPELDRAYPAAIDALRRLGIEPFEER